MTEITFSQESTVSDIITIDAGGTIYRVLRSTLQADPNSLLASIAEKWSSSSISNNLPITTNKAIFLDVDGKAFGYILAYLRCMAKLPGHEIWRPPTCTSRRAQVYNLLKHFKLPDRLEREEQSVKSTPLLLLDTQAWISSPIAILDLWPNILAFSYTSQYRKGIRAISGVDSLSRDAFAALFKKQFQFPYVGWERKPDQGVGTHFYFGSNKRTAGCSIDEVLRHLRSIYEVKLINSSNCVLHK